MKHAQKIWIAWLILCLGITMTIFATFDTKSDIETLENRDFHFLCNDVKSKIIVNLTMQRQLLQSGVGLFESSDFVSRNEWHNFVKALHLETEVPGIQGVGFSLAISPENLSHHINQIRGEGFPHYTIKPEGQRELYTSIIYLEPFSGRNLRAFGYDMFSEPIRRKAMTQAVDSHKVVLSGKVTLLQETTQNIQSGVLMYAPVYKKGMSIRTPEERRTALLGWVYTPYRLNDFMQGVLGDWLLNEGSKIRLQIYNDTLSKEALLYDSKNADSTMADIYRFSTEIPVSFGGSTWILSFAQYQDSAPTPQQGKVWIIFISGITISILLFALVISMLNTRSQALNMAAALTAELTENQTRLQNVIAGTNAGTWEWNIRTSETIFNERWAEIVGYTLEELQPTTINTWEILCHPDDLVESGVLLKRHFRGEIPYYTFDSRMKHRNGSWVWVLDRGKVIEWDKEGKPLRMYGTHTDISDRKQAEIKLVENEARLRTIIENEPECIKIVDQNGILIQMNPAGLSMIEADSWEDVAHRSVFGLITTEHRDAFMEMHHDVINGKSRQLEFEIIGIKGGRHWMESHAVPIQVEGATLHLAVTRDITEKKQQEIALRSMLAEKEMLLREVHHRVKNNLAAIIGLVGLQKSAVGENADSSGFDDLALRIQSMALVHESLYHSDNLAQIHFQEYLENLSFSLRSAFTNGGKVHFAIFADIDVGLDIAIPCGMIINELLTNSLKYAFPQGKSRTNETAEIQISIVRDGEQYTLTVEDNGIGLPQDYDWQHAPSLGQRLIRMLGEHQLGATITLDLSTGTKFRFQFSRKDKNFREKLS